MTVDPDYAPIWDNLGLIVRAEIQFGFDPRPRSLDRALEAGHRAIHLAPNEPAYHAQLAIAHLIGGDIESFRTEVEKSLSLSKSNNNLGGLGLYLVYAGDWEKGLALIEKAKTLDPFFPNWYHNGAFHDFYRKQKYDAALDSAKGANAVDFVQSHSQLVAVHGQLGRRDESEVHINRIFAIDPTFDARKHWTLRFRFQPQYLEYLLEGMRKGGMKTD